MPLMTPSRLTIAHKYPYRSTPGTELTSYAQENPWAMLYWMPLPGSRLPPGPVQEGGSWEHWPHPMGYTPAEWISLSHQEKQGAMDRFFEAMTNHEATVFNEIAGSPRYAARNTPASWLRLRNGPPVASPVVSQSDIESAIRVIDAYCQHQPNLTRALRPAGQASYTASASYLNGPTLLASAVAFAAGYATSRYLRAKR